MIGPGRGHGSTNTTSVERVQVSSSLDTLSTHRKTEVDSEATVQAYRLHPSDVVPEMARDILFLSSLLVFPALVSLHLWVAPYTKVEESFNVQAVHDILRYGVPASGDITAKFHQFDHTTFPGAVPRTFLGALLLSGVTWFNNLFVDHDLSHSGIKEQIQVRSILGWFTATSLAFFAYNIRHTYGRTTALWYIILQAGQFHIWYYASRTLPNTFAFILSTTSFALLLPNPTSTFSRAQRTRLALYILTLATVIFRAELIIILVVQGIYMLLKPPTVAGKTALIKKVILPAVVTASFIGITLTIAIDSYFWNPAIFPSLDSLIWPEAWGFLANITPSWYSKYIANGIFAESDHNINVLGASAWGTSPWHWYLTSSLPRLLMIQLPMLDIFFVSPYTMTDEKVRDNLIPSYAYILLYSVLSHKETRFIFPVVPSLTFVAAATMTRLWQDRNKNVTSRFLTYMAIVATIVQTLLCHAVLLPLSALSYPGGRALRTLHDLHYHSHPPLAPEVFKVHLTNLALQTGVTRFTEDPTNSITSSLEKYETSPNTQTTDSWHYDKTSNSTSFSDPLWWDQFDYLIIEDPALVIGAWEVLEEVQALGRPRLLASDEERNYRFDFQNIKGVLDSNTPYPDPRTTGIHVNRNSPTTYPSDTFRLLKAMYPPIPAALIGSGIDLAHDVLREGRYLPAPLASITRKISGGRWIEVPLITKLYILQKSSSGIYTNTNFSIKPQHQPIINHKYKHSHNPNSNSNIDSDNSNDADSNNPQQYDVHNEPESATIPALADQPSREHILKSLDDLGPLVVNKDNTLSRLDNWAQMTEQERRKTLAYLKKRNMLRMEEHEV